MGTVHGLSACVISRSILWARFQRFRKLSSQSIWLNFVRLKKLGQAIAQIHLGAGGDLDAGYASFDGAVCRRRTGQQQQGSQRQYQHAREGENHNNHDYVFPLNILLMPQRTGCHIQRNRGHRYVQCNHRQRHLPTPLRPLPTYPADSSVSECRKPSAFPRTWERCRSRRTGPAPCRSVRPHAFRTGKCPAC